MTMQPVTVAPQGGSKSHHQSISNNGSGANRNYRSYGYGCNTLRILSVGMFGLNMYLIMFVLQAGFFHNLLHRHDLLSSSTVPAAVSSYFRRRTSKDEEEWTTGSLSILMKAVQDVTRPVLDGDSGGGGSSGGGSSTDNPNTFDLTNEIKRCSSSHFFNRTFQYGGRTTRRRIFAGGLLADDTWHALGASALENYGIFHSVTFVESNRTQSYEPRRLRFVPGSKDLKILQSGIFGPNTPVYVENFVHEYEENSLTREHMMRQLILSKWKSLGMKRNDIGLIMDVDEIASRSILRAVQICDFKSEKISWDDDSTAQSCRSPVLRLSTPVFEGSPKCVHRGRGSTKFRRFTNPTMVIGACIEGIGDSERHPSVPRVDTDRYGRPQGKRPKGYGEGNNYNAMPQKGKDDYFPLYSAADFRNIMGTLHWGDAGYHLHNFFDSAEKIRFKHAHYGHKHETAFTAPLGAMNSDLMVFAKCAHNVSDDGNRKRSVQNGLEEFAKEFDLPMAFRLEGYADARHDEVTMLLAQDEEEYGRADDFDGHHLYQEKMLTHPGRRHKHMNASAIT